MYHETESDTVISILIIFVINTIIFLFSVDFNVEDYDNLQISNHGRTLTVSDLVEHREHEFQFKVLLFSSFRI